MHETFSYTAAGYDIAIIRLPSPLTFNDYVQPVCIPSTQVEDGTECVVTGWGKTRCTYMDQTFSARSRFHCLASVLDGDVLSLDDCNNDFVCYTPYDSMRRLCSLLLPAGLPARRACLPVLRLLSGPKMFFFAPLRRHVAPIKVKFGMGDRCQLHLGLGLGLGLGNPTTNIPMCNGT